MTCMHSCMHSLGMAKSARKVDLQIRGVPVELRRRLGQKATSKGLSMSKYVIDVLKDDIERPTLEEWFREVDALRPKREPTVAPSRTLREIRDAIDRGEKV